ncbi:MAG: VIT1/CCC1 transporter family protein [Promethearchaeota archaeon]
MKFTEKLHIYNEITNFTGIARRYFINNFYDGMLTILGILLGFFVIILKDPSQPTIPSSFIIITGLGTSISMFVSGISGSYLSERAEQIKEKKELGRAMTHFEADKEENDLEEIQKAMITPLKNKQKLNFLLKGKIKSKKVKTLHEKAETFTGIIVSLINGFSPFLGGIIPIIPFFLVSEAGIGIFIISFVIIFVCIIFLGMFLGKISKESMIKNILQMGLAFMLTIVIIILFLG